VVSIINRIACYLTVVILFASGCSGNVAGSDSASESRQQELISQAQASLDKKDYLLARDYLKQYTDIAAHTPQTLWIGVQAEYPLGNQRAVSAYVQQLREQYPDSEEYQAYLYFLRNAGYGH
jgi:Tfp pilus assembly protein PilF